MKNDFALGVFYFFLGNIVAWFQFNSQFVWEWWKDKPLLSNFIFAVPMGLFFWYAVKHIVASSGQLWTSKLVGFGVSNIVFGVMTYIFLKESAFTAKTLTCLFLACIIIAIQIFWE